MRSIFIPAGIALLCALSLPARADPTLTLEAAVQRAFANNPALRAASADIDIATGQRMQAGGLPNPSLSYLSEGVRNDARTTTILLSQAIELGGKRGARMALAERERDIAEAALASQQNDLRAAVVTAFFDLLSSQEGVLLAQASLDLAHSVSETVGKRVTAGKVSPVDATRARVAEASARIALSQASTALANARLTLAATWGSVTPDASVLATPPAPSDQPASTRASPQIARARSEIARQEALEAVERSRRYPDVTVSLGTKRDEQTGIRQAVIGVAVPLPLFDTNQGNLFSAQRRTDQARDQLLAVENSVAQDLAQATLRRDTALAELTILQGDILPGAESAYNAATRGFALGKFGFLDVLDAQRTLFQAKTQTIHALAESHRAAAEIDRITGHRKETP